METTTRRIILALLGLLQRASPALLYLSKILSRVPSQERKNLSQVKNNIFDHAVLRLLLSPLISFLALLFSTFFAFPPSPSFPSLSFFVISGLSTPPCWLPCSNDGLQTVSVCVCMRRGGWASVGGVRCGIAQQTSLMG